MSVKVVGSMTQSINEFTCGIPPDPLTLMPPLLSALSWEQVSTSTSFSFSPKPASGTSHEGVDELPPFDRSVSKGGFDTTSDEGLAERNLTYMNKFNNASSAIILVQQQYTHRGFQEIFVR